MMMPRGRQSWTLRRFRCLGHALVRGGQSFRFVDDLSDVLTQNAPVWYQLNLSDVTRVMGTYLFADDICFDTH